MLRWFVLQYTPAIDIWSIGCIFAEMLTGKPLFPGKNVVHQLDLMTDLLGTPPPETIARVSSFVFIISKSFVIITLRIWVGSNLHSVNSLGSKALPYSVV